MGPAVRPLLGLSRLLQVFVMGLYITSFAADLLDGKAARYFDQCSSLGGVLDMVTDRCSTAGLLVILGWSEFYPQYRLGLLFCVVLDFSSHWCAMYLAAVKGEHHKSDEANQDVFFLMRWYYSVYPFFGYLCVGQEFFYIFLYMFHPRHGFNPVLIAGLTLEQLCYYVCGPAWLLKQIVNLCQLGSSSWGLAEEDFKQVKARKD